MEKFNIRQKAQMKLHLFKPQKNMGIQWEVSVTEEEVTVNVTASGGGMRLSLCRKAAVTEPEKKIRNIRRFQ